MTAARHIAAAVCGGCGSAHMVTAIGDGCSYGACPACGRLQEVETRADPATQLCDNCAFRPGSGERSDPYRWWMLSEAFEAGQPFYCHKGMAARIATDGCTLEYLPGDDLARLQPCAGWIAWTKAQAAKPVGPRAPTTSIGE